MARDIVTIPASAIASSKKVSILPGAGCTNKIPGNGPSPDGFIL